MNKQTLFNKNSTKTVITSSILTAMAMTYTQLAAAQSNDIHGFLAAGAFVGSDYEGSDEYTFNPAIAARLQYKNYYIQTEGLGAKINLSPAEHFEFGPMINYRMGRDDDIENLSVSRMTEIDDAFEGGAFARVQKRNIMSGGDEIGFEVKVLSDLSDTHEGMTVTFGPDYAFQATSKLRLTTSVEATYADDDYMDTYFGVNTDNVGSSGLSHFKAESGLKDVGASMMAHYQLSEKWSVIGITGYKKLLGDAKDTPLVEQEGSDNQFMALGAISYSF